MTVPIDLNSVVSNIRDADLSENCSVDNWKKLLSDLESLLSSEEGVNFLKQQNNHFECVLASFTKVLYCDHFEIAKSLFKYFDTVIEIFRSKLPKIKKCDWWKKFELDYLVKSIPKLGAKISPMDGSWVQIWSFTASLVVSDTALSTVPLNTLLSISESSFKKGKEHPEVLDQAWQCWIALIEAFGRSPKILLPSKTLNLLLKPLLGCYSVSKFRISTWIRLIEVKGITSSESSLNQLVVSLCKAMYKTAGDKSISRHLPDECAEALVKLLSYDQVQQSCLSEIVSVFGASVNSRPCARAIEKLSNALLKAINNCKDDSISFNLWQDILNQYKNCTESPILSQACGIIFSEVNFLRWVDSGVVEGKEINELMDITDFRGKVLLRSITSLPILDVDENNSQKKKTKKGSSETIWSNYCEAYISWWSNQGPPTPKENYPESSIFSRDGNDYHAMQALILYPIQLTSWNASTFRTWSKVCECCHKYRILQSMSKQIFDTLDQQQHFQSQKAMDILSCLSGLDNIFWKNATKTLEFLIPKVYSMEVKHIMDLLNILETAVPSNELSSIINRVLKNVNEMCVDFDQLNVHKIKTKVGKISRKMEQLTGSAEKEMPNKAQRTPFRTQSNFLQRLAKAEEKNKTKTTFLSSIFPDTEDKNKIGTDDGETDSCVIELSSQDASQENVSKLSDDITTKKLIKPLDDSENMPIIMPLMSPSVLKESRSSLKGDNDETEVIAAEKENLIIQHAPTLAATPSPTSRLKITNTRELKTVDALSPSMTKKTKPLAGQKSTPKKVTPSKVSYFDDDASDCVMVPPKAKTTPLTEHQMEMMNKRRTDIPALYQDLSQDTQLSNNPPSDIVVQEMKKGVTLQADTEDIVHGTPSPAMLPSQTTPERPKSAAKPSSAKQLNFNCLVETPTTPLEKNESSLVSSTCDGTSVPPKTEITSIKMPNGERLNIPTVTVSTAAFEADSISEKGGLISTTVPEPMECGDTGVDTVNTEKGDGLIETNKNAKGNSSENNEASNKEDDPKSLTPKKENGCGEEKSRRKRKSEPAKFSPKLTRSKRSLKSSTPDAKFSKSSPSSEPTATLDSKLVNSTKESSSEENKTDSNKEEDKLDAEEVSKDDVRILQDEEITVNGLVAESVSQTQLSLSSNTDEAENTSEVVLEKDSSETPGKKGRKRKTEDSQNSDSCKKSKISEDDGSSVKKASALKKKKKPFRLNSGATNLENWLVKTERVQNSVIQSNSEEVSCEPLDMELPCSDDVSVIELNNSDEIVPSTQELDSGTELYPSIIPNHSAKTKFDPGVVILIEDESECEKPPSPVSVDTQLLSEPQNEMKVPEIIEFGDRVLPEFMESPNKDEGSPSLLQRLAEESPNDDIDLIITSPTRRNRRASSVMRGEGDTYLLKDKAFADVSEESNEEEKRATRVKSKSTVRARKSLHPPGGRSARMLKLAASTTYQEDEEVTGLVTPTRKRENIIPVTYGDNWPKGPTEDWVACTPVSPYTSPFRSALKKPLLPGEEQQGTPQRPQNSLCSPLLSSAKKKRVVFLDPPVTRGLIYERGSPFGAVHLADVPQGSPYPTWKCEDTFAKLSSSTSRSAGSDPQVLTEPSPETPILTPEALAKSTITIPSNELEYSVFKDKFHLEDSFIEIFSQSMFHIRSLLTHCFESSKMEETVNEWKLGDFRQICTLQLTILDSVRNEKGETLSGVLKAVKNHIPALDPPPSSKCVESQTVSPALVEAHVQTNVPVAQSSCQTYPETSTAQTNTTPPMSSEGSTQADLELPTSNELEPILKRLGCRDALKYFSESLKLLSSLQDNDT